MRGLIFYTGGIPSEDKRQRPGGTESRRLPYDSHARIHNTTPVSAPPADKIIIVKHRSGVVGVDGVEADSPLTAYIP